jgi:hypothetical protein
LPEPCPAPIRAVVERYLRLRLEAKFDRPQTVRLARESLRRFINWLSAEYPDVGNLSRVDRSTAEEYLKWLPTYLSNNTGKPLAVRFAVIFPASFADTPHFSPTILSKVSSEVSL